MLVEVIRWTWAVVTRGKFQKDEHFLSEYFFIVKNHLDFELLRDQGDHQ